MIFNLGMAILVPTLAIAVCASTLVLVADDLITIELHHIINGRPSIE